MKKIILVFAVLTFLACKKDSNDSNPSFKCRISKMTDQNGKSITITYNEAGEYQTIKSEIDNSTTSFVYSNNSIVATIKNVADQMLRKSTFALNSQGMIYGARQDYYDPLTNTPIGWYNTVYEYNGTQLVKSTGTNSGNRTIVTINYVWSDGNVTSQSSAGSSTFIEYYTDKEVQPGDYMNVLLTADSGIPSRKLIRNKNLVKGEGAAQISYTFENDGKIKTVVVNGNTAYTLQYECN